MHTRHGNRIKAVVVLFAGIAIGTLAPNAQPTAAKEEVKKVDPPRIGYVNIVMALRSFENYNVPSPEISKERRAFFEHSQTAPRRIAGLKKKLGETADTENARRLRSEIAAIEELTAKLDREQKAAGDRVIVGAYEDLRAVIRELAHDFGLDVVEAHPASFSPREDYQAVEAHFALRPPALYPLYIKPELDFTDEVVARLKKRLAEKEQK